MKMRVIFTSYLRYDNITIFFILVSFQFFAHFFFMDPNLTISESILRHIGRSNVAFKIGNFLDFQIASKCPISLRIWFVGLLLIAISHALSSWHSLSWTHWARWACSTFYIIIFETCIIYVLNSTSSFSLLVPFYPLFWTGRWCACF